MTNAIVGGLAAGALECKRLVALSEESDADTTNDHRQGDGSDQLTLLDFRDGPLAGRFCFLGIYMLSKEFDIQSAQAQLLQSRPFSLPTGTSDDHAAGPGYRHRSLLRRAVA